VTVRGRLLVTIVLILSLGIVGIFTATIASIFIADALKGRSKMPSRGFKDHIIICNWNRRGLHLIKELHNPVLKNIRPIVIVANYEDTIDLPKEDEDERFNSVYFVKGDPTDETILNKAYLKNAYSVIILSDISHDNYADSKSVLITLAVKNLNPDVYVIAEVQDVNSVVHFKNAKIDELVSSSQLGVQLISQSAITHGITSFYNRLLTFSEETNEVYLVDLPEEFLGKSFSEASIILSQIRHAEPVILVGVKREDRVFINPRNEDFGSFESDDKLFVISFDRPDLKVSIRKA
jgi:voltage-gated potassium channel